MDSNSLKIICYTGGTCGDLITALIDPVDAVLNSELGTVTHTVDRAKLKKPHLFNNNLEKANYLLEAASHYRSIPSHDLDFHVEQQHDFMSITVNDPTIAVWAAERFKKCHRPHVWAEMQKVCGAKSIEDYANILIHYSNMVQKHTNKLIQLEDIVSGQLINVLEKLISTELSDHSKNFYQAWLDMQQ